jgi:hypothetical protein
MKIGNATIVIEFIILGLSLLWFIGTSIHAIILAIKNRKPQ